MIKKAIIKNYNIFGFNIEGYNKRKIILIIRV